MANEKFIIQYFNSKKTRRFGFSDENVKLISDCYDAGFTDIDLKIAVNEFIGDDIRVCFDVARLISARDSKKALEAIPDEYEPAVAPEVETVHERKLESTMDILGKALAEVIAKSEGDKIAAGIMGNVQKSVESFIEKTYGKLPTRQIVEVGERKVEFDEVLHEKFETVLKFVQMNEPVFLTGAAGTGKNVICKQVAKTLGLDFYFSNAVTQEYKITGFTDAMGVFQESQFYKAFKNGGLFMLDEIDASIPEVLVILNAAIANRYFDFPAPIGYVEAHEAFRVVAAGNTFGTGATYQYVGRNQLDAASLDRFAMVRIDYSLDIEKSVALGDMSLVTFAREFRKAASTAGIQTVVSYRSIGRIAKMQAVMSLEEVMTACLLKGMEKDDIRMICKSMSMDNSNKYYAILSKNGR